MATDRHTDHTDAEGATMTKTITNFTDATERIEARIARGSVPMPDATEHVLSTGRVARCGIHTASCGTDATNAEREEAWAITNAKCAAFDAERDAIENAAILAYRATGVPAHYNAWKGAK